jgi:hypothetical protein
MRYAMHEERGPWVVYFKALEGKLAGARAVCGQAEWDAMERAKPGALTLIRGGIRNETEAELLARGTSGDRPSQSNRKKVPDSSPADSPCIPIAPVGIVMPKLYRG